MVGESKREAFRNTNSSAVIFCFGTRCGAMGGWLLCPETDMRVHD